MTSHKHTYFYDSGMGRLRKLTVKFNNSHNTYRLFALSVFFALIQGKHLLIQRKYNKPIHIF